MVAIVSRSIFARPHRQLPESGCPHTNHNRFIRIKKFRDGHSGVALGRAPGSPFPTPLAIVELHHQAPFLAREAENVPLSAYPSVSGLGICCAKEQ